MRTFSDFIFDLDGTLVDSLPGIAHSFNVATREVLSESGVYDIGALIGPPIRDIFRLAIGVEANAAKLDQLEQAFRQNYDTEGWRLTKTYSGVIDSLVELINGGARCYIVTNKPMLPARRILEHLGLKTLFIEVVTRESRRPAFPNKTEATLDLVSRMHALSDSIVFIGDSLDDAEAAHSAKLHFVAVDYGFGQVSTRAPQLVSQRISAFPELIPLLAIKSS